MQQTVIKVGNSAGLILPQSLLKQTGLNPGDKINVNVKDKDVIISPVKNLSQGVDSKFAKIVDDFITDHEDVLKKLANK